MVVFESLLGIGAKSAAGITLKAAGTGAASTAMVTATPAPTMDQTGDFLFSPPLHQLHSSFLPSYVSFTEIMSPITQVAGAGLLAMQALPAKIGSLGFATTSMVPAGISAFHPPVAMAGIDCGLMRLCGLLEEETEEEPRKGFARVVPIGLTIVGLADLYMGGVLLHSISLPTDVPLKAWVAGGLLLSFPMSYAVTEVAEIAGFRAGFLMELMSVLASFVWLASGTLMVSGSTVTLDNAPLLWWSCYVLCVLMWSFLGTAIICSIVTTVLALLLGQKHGPPSQQQ
jgi:hypothetical protein